MLFIYLLTLLTSLVSPNFIQAQSPSPDQVSSPTPTQATSLDEIQKIRQAVQQKVKEKLKQISTQTNTKKAIIGDITQINDQEITIQYQNQNRILAVDENTVFIDAKRNKAKLEDLKVGQGVLAMGYTDENNILNTKRLIFIEIPELANPQTVVVGNIVDISQSSPVFVLVPTKDKDSQFQIKTDAKTYVSNKAKETLKVSSLVSGQKVIVIIKPDEKMAKTYYATDIISLQLPAASPTPSSDNE